MKIRFPLYAQIVTVFFGNILLLLAIYLFFFSSQFNSGWETLLYSPIGERVQSVAFVIERQIKALPEREWNHVLSASGEFYGVKFFLFDDRGREIAGERITLPAQVMKRITEHHFGFKHFRTDGKSALPDGPPPPPPPGAFPFSRPPGRFFIHTTNPDMTWIGAMIFARQQPGTLLATTPNLFQTRLIFDFGPALLCCLAIFFISLLVWWPFIYRVTSALHRLTYTAEKIAEGKFDTALNMRRFDEIGQLGQAITLMSAKLKMFMSGQKRFLGDIAHELCSPLARLQMAIAVIEPTCTREQAATLNDIQEEVEQMGSLINELLAFSKAGIMGKDLALTSVNLEALLSKVTSAASFKNASTLEIQTPLLCLGDELLLERAFSNILRNAIRYAANSGPVIIKAERIEKNIVIKFLDNGPGVQPETLEFLGEPFYRPESSRSRSSGGVGLGLSIVKTCIEACQGSVTLRNRQPKGLEVEVTLLAVL